VELSTFLSEIGGTITESERDDLIDYLARYPNQGDEIPGTGGLRKLRWKSQNKGKRSGLRVIYFFYNHTEPVYLLAVYKKGDQENLSPKGVELLSKIARELKKTFKLKSGGIR
jgi:mRNA-degrading endonuclease RelE of RelBE toxin-antitoxin system